MVVLNIMKTAMNISLRFLLTSAKEQKRSWKNGAVTGTVSDLTHSLADVALTGMPLIIPFIDWSEYIGIYSRSEYIWFISLCEAPC